MYRKLVDENSPRITELKILGKYSTSADEREKVVDEINNINKGIRTQVTEIFGPKWDVTYLISAEDEGRTSIGNQNFGQYFSTGFSSEPIFIGWTSGQPSYEIYLITIFGRENSNGFVRNTIYNYTIATDDFISWEQVYNYTANPFYIFNGYCWAYTTAKITTILADDTNTNIEIGVQSVQSAAAIYTVFGVNRSQFRSGPIVESTMNGIHRNGAVFEAYVSVQLNSGHTRGNYLVAPCYPTANTFMPGVLHWYRQADYLNGSIAWQNNGNAKEISRGWERYSLILAADSGVIYGFTADGRLYWQKEIDSQNAGTTWANNGEPIYLGSGWNIYQQIFTSTNGVIYGITADGSLHRYRYLDYLTGGKNWANNGNSNLLGSGWNIYKEIIAGDNGVIYAITKTGILHWYRDLNYLAQGPGWANNGNAITLGTGWNIYSHIFTPGKGVIYGMTSTGALHWYRQNDYLTGGTSWANNGQSIGLGFNWNYYSNITASPEGIIYAMY
jgi:hypothetical protein